MANSKKMKLTLFNGERDMLVDIMVSPEDYSRAKNDIAFATETMNAATAIELAKIGIQSDGHEVEGEASCAGVTYDDVDSDTNFCEGNEESDDSLRTMARSAGGENLETGSCYRWTAPVVLLLLETYRTKEGKMTSGKQSQKKTWEEVSSVLNNNGHIVTGPQCSAKLRSLKKTYKGIKDHNNKSGNDRRTWEFCEVMDQIFGKKAWTDPVALASSSGLSVRKSQSPVSSDNGHASEPQTSKQSVASLLTKRLRQKDDHEAAKANRHRERMEIDNKFLEVLQKIADK